MMKTKRVLVTGGAGFIGSNLVDDLLEKGFLVDVVDDLSNGSRQNISHLLDHEHFHLHEVNLSEWLKSSKSEQRFDVVFHLASPVGVSVVEQISQHEYDILEDVNRELIERAYHNSEKLCLTSSSEVYGDLGDQQGKGRMNEDFPLDEFPPGKRWRYARLKRSMELFALEKYQNRMDDLFITRLFNVVGERQNPKQGMVLPTFVHAVREGKPIRIFGDGSQQRCFSDVRDVVKVLVKGGLSDETPTILNIGTKLPLTLNFLAEQVNEVGSEMGFSTSEIIFLKKRIDEIFRRVPNTNRLEEWLGTVPSIDIQFVIRRVFEDQENRNREKNGEVLA